MQGQPDRIEQFKADIADLKITDPSTSRDHLAARLGIAAMVIGIVLGIYAYSLSYGADADNPAPQQRDAIVLALIGVTVAVAGAALYLKGALAGFLRFWLVRDLHERRAQTDRLLDGLGGDQPAGGRTHLTAYVPVKLGGRFSAKAVGPSLASLVAKIGQPSSSSLARASCSPRLALSRRLLSTAWTARGPLAAISAASSWALARA